MENLKNEYDRLVDILRTQGYMHVNRLSAYQTMLKIPVQDFLSIVSFIGNLACGPYCGVDPFPKSYLRPTFFITHDEQGFCYELIKELALKLGFKHKMEKTIILTQASPMYFAHRAEFLITMCDYLEQVYVTPPSSPSSASKKSCGESENSSVDNSSAENSTTESSASGNSFIFGYSKSR